MHLVEAPDLHYFVSCLKKTETCQEGKKWLKGGVQANIEQHINYFKIITETSMAPWEKN